MAPGTAGLRDDDSPTHTITHVSEGVLSPASSLKTTLALPAAPNCSQLGCQGSRRCRVKPETTGRVPLISLHVSVTLSERVCVRVCKYSHKSIHTTVIHAAAFSLTFFWRLLTHVVVSLVSKRGENSERASVHRNKPPPCTSSSGPPLTKLTEGDMTGQIFS